MTNLDKYKEDLIRICTSTEELPAVLFNKVADCETTLCTDCLLHKKDVGCHIGIILWLCEEYKEPIKLTAKEKTFLSVLETGWIARDSSGILNWYQKKPERKESIFVACNTKVIYIPKFFVLFDFIKWEDEPYSVEEMLKWEVEE